MLAFARLSFLLIGSIGSLLHFLILFIYGGTGYLS